VRFFYFEIVHNDFLQTTRSKWQIIIFARIVSRGEHKQQYSQSFRQAEFLSALSATISESSGLRALDVMSSLLDRAVFTNAFSYKRIDAHLLPPSVSLCQIEMYNNALQFLDIRDDDDLTAESVHRTTERCSLIHSTYIVLADAHSYANLVDRSLLSETFNNMIQSDGAKATWRLRRHEFSFAVDDDNPRFGKRGTRSVLKERAALVHLEPLLTQLGGRVDLHCPECDICLLEGLSSTTETSSLFKILARKLVDGARHNKIAPRTRICITMTPLCSIAAYLLCNIALIQENQTILDPFAGSAATLLAAALISPSVRTVGIEIASDGFISRSNIRKDFKSRGVEEPIALLQGDIMDPSTRDNAREAIGNRAFDVIITDPPYGRREAMSGVGVGNDKSALNELIDAIGHDRCRGKSLLRPGGRLVAFLPCPKDSNVLDLLPSQERLSYAGLKLLEKREQKLNDSSRWMVSLLSQPIVS
jgi:tRNA1(Val) A37 N6-methylase TrmN6